MRLRRRCRAPVYLLGIGRHTLPEAPLRPADRPDRHPVEVPRVNARAALSAPAYHSVVKLALTIFDLADVLGFGLAYPAEVISN
jgi:hypothetical protein